MRHYFETIKNWLIDLIFPQHVCCLCRAPGRYNTNRPWCSQCHDKLEKMSTYLPICEKCGKYLLKDQRICTDCQQYAPEFHIARAVGPYDELYRVAIKVFKFMCRKKLAEKMGQMMGEKVKSEPEFWPLDLIIPVPASQGSLKQRGFNQTELLGCHISRTIGVKMDCQILQRTKETPSQRELTKKEREQNLRCAFQVTQPHKIKGKRILLVDDIYTTGSTCRECTRTLLEAGAQKVSVINWATGISC
ncbi:MAG: double zinc ribbon domain-containing protein [Syntrophomonadaceae bacterium]|jgi:competence protein ComFC